MIVILFLFDILLNKIAFWFDLQTGPGTLTLSAYMKTVVILSKLLASHMELLNWLW